MVGGTVFDLWRTLEEVPVCDCDLCRGERVGDAPAHEAAQERRSCLFAPIGTRVHSHSGTRQIFSRVGIGKFGDRLGRSRAHYIAAPAAALGAEINHPIGGLDDFKIVLDDDNRSPCINQTAKRRKEFADVIKMQPGGRLVEDVEQPPLALAPSLPR